MRDGGKRCLEPGCNKSSQGIPQKCKQHGGGKRCLETGCDKSAVTGNTQKCKAHGGGKRCLEPGCKSSARGGSTQKCTVHGGGRRCLEPNCNNGGLGNTQKCKTHGGGRRCLEPGCKSSGLSGSIQKCKVHGGGKRCLESGCTTSAESGNIQKCTVHGGGKRCLELGCNTGALGNTQRCAIHGGGHRCQGANCPTGSVGNSVNKKGDLCSVCQPGVNAKRKKKESLIDELLKKNKFMAKREHRIQYCHVEDKKQYAMLDFVIELPSHRVIISVDENQHSETNNIFGYNVTCELSRMSKILGAIMQTEENIRPTKWIRYNPDVYRVQGTKILTPTIKRHEELLKEIKKLPTKPTHIVYMFYDQDTNSQPEIFNHQDFDDLWKQQYC